MIEASPGVEVAVFDSFQVLTAAFAVIGVPFVELREEFFAATFAFRFRFLQQRRGRPGAAVVFVVEFRIVENFVIVVGIIGAQLRRFDRNRFAKSRFSLGFFVGALFRSADRVAFLQFGDRVFDVVAERFAGPIFGGVRAFARGRFFFVVFDFRRRARRDDDDRFREGRFAGFIVFEDRQEGKRLFRLVVLAQVEPDVIRVAGFFVELAMAFVQLFRRKHHLRVRLRQRDSGFVSFVNVDGQRAVDENRSRVGILLEEADDAGFPAAQRQGRIVRFERAVLVRPKVFEDFDLFRFRVAEKDVLARPDARATERRREGNEERAQSAKLKASRHFGLS